MVYIRHCFNSFHTKNGNMYFVSRVLHLLSTKFGISNLLPYLSKYVFSIFFPLKVWGWQKHPSTCRKEKAVTYHATVLLLPHTERKICQRFIWCPDPLLIKECYAHLQILSIFQLLYEETQRGDPYHITCPSFLSWLRDCIRSQPQLLASPCPAFAFRPLTV